MGNPCRSPNVRKYYVSSSDEQGEQDWAAVDREGSHSCNRIGTRIDARITRIVPLRWDLSKVGIEWAAVDRNGVSSCAWIVNRIDVRITIIMLLRRDLSKVGIDAAAVHQIVIA